MLESASDFKGYIQKLGIARSEGILLRYLAEAYRSLDRTVPIEKRDERLRDIISWLGFVVRSVDSSLVDEWENAGNPAALDAAPPQGIDEVVADRRGCTLLVRNALFRRVTLAAREHVRDLGELDDDWGMSEIRWQKALDAYHEQHEEILTDGDARSAAMFSIDESDEKTAHVWHVHQIFADEDGDHDLASWAMSIWTPRKTAARSSSKTTASALSRTCSRTSRTYWNETKRGRWQYRQRPRFCTICYALLGIFDLIRICLGGSSFVSGAAPRASSNAASWSCCPM